MRSGAQPLVLLPGPFLLSWLLESLAKKPTIYPAGTVSHLLRAMWNLLGQDDIEPQG